VSAATVSINKKLTDGTLLSIGGTNADDFLINAKALLGGESDVLAAFEQAFGASFSQATANVTNAFPEAQFQAPPQPQQHEKAFRDGGGVFAPPAAPAAAPRQGPPPGTSAPTCDHGQPREWKTGTSKAGKAYKGWFCQNPNRDAQCAPQWVR
jgi:hypothetical protein